MILDTYSCFSPFSFVFSCQFDVTSRHSFSSPSSTAVDKFACFRGNTQSTYIRILFDLIYLISSVYSVWLLQFTLYSRFSLPPIDRVANATVVSCTRAAAVAAATVVVVCMYVCVCQSILSDLHVSSVDRIFLYFHTSVIFLFIIPHRLFIVCPLLVWSLPYAERKATKNTYILLNKFCLYKKKYIELIIK